MSIPRPERRARGTEMAQRRNHLFQRVPVAPMSLFKPVSRRVTFEIISPRRSHPIPDSSAMEISGLVASGQQTANLASWPSTYPTCQLQDIAAAQGSDSSEQTCPDQAGHDLGALLIRRAQHRQRSAWIRKRIEQDYSHQSDALRDRHCIRMQCAASGLLFMALLVTYLTLTFNVKLSTAVSIMLVLFTLLSGILFLHGVFRAWILRRRKGNHRVSRHRPAYGSSYFHNSRHRHHQHQHQHHHRSHRARARNHHYAGPESPYDVLPCDDSLFTPTTPVRVHLLRDEEAFMGEKMPPIATELERADSDEEEATPISANTDTPLPTPPPPAYGLWRCSVRADPNLLYWQRSPVCGCGQSPRIREPCANGERAAANQTGLRPPSYMSENALYLDHGQQAQASPCVQNQSPLGEETRDNPFASSAHTESVVQEDWPLRRVSGAVQEVTRILLADSINNRDQ